MLWYYIILSSTLVTWPLREVVGGNKTRDFKFSMMMDLERYI
jgi:hypothetical protein